MNPKHSNKSSLVTDEMFIFSLNSMMSFSGKVVIVTGASSGIGAAAAVLFAREGARIALVDCNETGLSSVAQQCAAHGNPPLPIIADITNELEAKAIITKTVDHFGKLHILVNNAGIYKKSLITDPNYLQNFDSIMNTNLRAMVQLTHLAAKHLMVTKGNIINVCSVASRYVDFENSSYCVSKAAVEHFTRCAALELAEFGVRVNCVSPGPVRTNILTNISEGWNDVNHEKWEELKSMTALHRVSEPAEIAEVILFLGSEKAKSVTGSAYLCDNGFLLVGIKAKKANC